jgi:hypothetical protein
MNRQIDILSKLLASENIDIIRSAVSTASFDIVNRVLTIPNWQDMTPTIENMLCFHETAHALFSPIELLNNDSKTPKSYINVIEDVRIERKIKSSFPGLRKDFVQGYKELNDRDFFKIANKDLSKLNLINRINLYFKAGSVCGVKFSKQEMVFVERAKTSDTVNDVITLSDDIYAFSKADYEDKKAQQQQEQMSQEPEESEDSDYENDDDSESYDDDNYESYQDDSDNDDESDSDEFESTNSKGSGSNNQLTNEEKEEEEALEASTQDAFDDNLGNLADTDLNIINHTTEIPSEFKTPIVGYKTVLSDLITDFNIGIQEGFARKDDSKIKTFKTESSNYVNYLVKEFEMKKSARRYARTTIAKTGGLNVNKLYAHKISDNLFKSISTVTDDKNHGMIFLLDWSGSMSYVMEDTLKQVINLASFCQRSGIAYQVLAFTSNYDKQKIDSRNLNATILSDQFNLLELFSNKMTVTEFNNMIGLMLSKPWYYSRGYRLGNTPLNSSLLYMIDYISKFSRMNNVEKTSLVVLTDGVSNTLDLDNCGNWKRKILHKLRDTKTKKDYVFPINADEQTQLLLKVIKDRYEIPVIGFYISGTTKRDIFNFIYGHINMIQRDSYTMYENIRSSIKKTGVYTLKTTAYDELYFLPASNNKTTVAELEIKPNASTTGMASQFKKFLNNKKTNRTVLDQFIKLVA